MDETTALLMMNRWAGQALPLSATSWHAGLLHVRLSGAASAVKAAQSRLGGEVLHDAQAFWQRLREQHTPFFDKRPLWRLSIKSTTAPLDLSNTHWIEWGGAVRWLVTEDTSASTTERMREAARVAGGHATLFRGTSHAHTVFTPLPPVMHRIHQQLKQRFDPKRIFNRGRLYPDL